MDRKEIRNNIVEALEKIFVFIDSTEEGDVSLEPYIEDSIQFMSFVVELEQTFNVEFPQELLAFDSFKTLDNISLIIEELLILKTAWY